ncbi:PREDICTED: protein moonraker-like isoform X4 [Acropora digitifera]|uniref:protein moonraker-like isoform X4 n=1 Tax=Acropora digitifera TaxID=70779 RepID=UPI00077A9905|nr:PREDICTED: protein moonraker-like isoform X4 [Acropora digitifera]
MATGIAWKPFQVPKMGLPASNAIYPSSVTVSRHLPMTPPGAIPLQMNQLKFNLGNTKMTAEQLTSRFRKPQPIVIERISETQPSDISAPYSHATLPASYPVLPSVSSSLSSERLALAVHLAKKDVKKVKKVGAENVLVSPDDGIQHRNVKASTKGKGSLAKKLKGKSLKSKSQDVLPEDNVTLRERVHHTVKKQEISAARLHEMHFYPAQREDDRFESDKERTQANEIRKLRKELQQYMIQIEKLKIERPEILRNKDKRLKRRRDSEVRLSDEEVDRRQVIRAEEQAARSARMLYVLQRQIQEIEDELNKKGRGIRHTKKSQTLSRLAAAHRGAVRALQTFISHAPLQPNISHGLPPMYQELSVLIRQLSMLASQLHIGGEDLNEWMRMEDRQKEVESAVTQGAQDKKEEKLSAFIQEVADRMPQDTKKILTPIKQVVTSSPDPTPERDAVLKAGLSALLRANNTPVQTQQNPVSLQVVKPIKPVKQAVLLPAQLKLASPRNPRVAERMLPSHHELVEREVERQRWLDEEAERRIHELQRMQKLESLKCSHGSRDILLSRQLITETEEAIRSRLKPLLDQAEAIADTNVKREREKKRSLQHELGNLASQTTMNQADVLAEKILDDILEETVVEMQRLEFEDDAESEAHELQDSSTLENILRRLQSFEKVEEEIRQHWVQVKYADVEKESTLPATVSTNRPEKDPKPIVFTRPIGDESHRLQSQSAKTAYHREKRESKMTLNVQDGLSETDSLSSLIEADSKTGSFPEEWITQTCARPTVVLNVPEEMRASIASYRNRFNKYLRATSTHEQGEFDPWGLVNRISEDLLEDAIHEVGNELDYVCDDYAEALYNEEFANADT